MKTIGLVAIALTCFSLQTFANDEVHCAANPPPVTFEPTHHLNTDSVVQSGSRCQTADDCPMGNSCLAGRCDYQGTCTTNDDCGRQFLCVLGTCTDN